MSVSYAAAAVDSESHFLSVPPGMIYISPVFIRRVGQWDCIPSSFQGSARLSYL